MVQKGKEELKIRNTAAALTMASTRLIAANDHNHHGNGSRCSGRGWMGRVGSPARRGPKSVSTTFAR
jgi:hypothetical protein